MNDTGRPARERAPLSKLSDDALNEHMAVLADRGLRGIDMVDTKRRWRDAMNEAAWRTRAGDARR